LKKDLACVETIRSWRADLGVVVAFGQILTQEFMDIFPLGCVNVHGSLLPKWRGAAPIQRSIEAGDIETGVALQKMVKKLDAGDVLGVRKIAIQDLNAQQLHDHLAMMGADLLHIELMDYVRGNLSGVAQDESQVTFAKKIEKSEAMIDWNQSAEIINNKVRAFVMGPGTYFQYKTKKIKLHQTKIFSKDSGQNKIGAIVVANGHELVIQCGAGQLQILELQPESRNRMSSTDFLKSHGWQAGEIVQ
jgi:methionyl-tRNA formyltransferase